MFKNLTIGGLFAVLLIGTTVMAAETDASKVLRNYSFRPYLCVVTGEFAKDSLGKSGSVGRKVNVFADNENEAAKEALNKLEIGATKDESGNVRLSWAPNWGGFGSVGKINCEKLIQ